MKLLCAILLASFAVPADLASPAVAAPVTVGWVERVRIQPGDVVLEAKLDTGATTSSLGADGIETFRRDGRRYVAFEVEGNGRGRVRIERPLVRMVRIKDRGVRSRERPVVMFGICIGPVFREFEVNLVDRSAFDYPMLVGRSFLAHGLAVDASRRFTVEPACNRTDQP